MNQFDLAVYMKNMPVGTYMHGEPHAVYRKDTYGYWIPCKKPTTLTSRPSGNFAYQLYPNRRRLTFS